MVERNEARKIAFVGTSSAGKTTIIAQLRKRNDPRFAFIEEAARSFFGLNPGLPEWFRFSYDAQRVVQGLQMESERRGHNSNAEIIFCDRSVIDAVVYVRANGDKEGSDKLLDRVSGWLPTYNKFLLLDPTDIPYKKDAVRQEEEETRQGFHQAFLEFFEEKGIPFELLSGTVEERIKRVEEIINIV